MGDRLAGAVPWVLVVTVVGGLVAYGEWGDDAWMPPKLVVIGIGTTVGWALVTAGVATGRWRLRAPRSLLPVVVLLAALAVGTVASLDPGTSFLGLAPRGAGLLTYLLVASLAYLLVVVAADDPAVLRRVPAAVAVGGTVNGAVVVLSFAGVGPASGTDTPRVGLIGNANLVGGVLAVAAAALLLLVVDAPSPRARIGWGAALALVVAALVGADSFGSFLATGAAGVAFVAVARTPVPRLVVRLGTAAVLLAVAVVLTGALARSASWAEPLRNLPVVGSDRVGARVDLWRTAGAMVIERPLVGTGLETLRLGYGRHTPAAPLGFPDTADEPHDVAFQHLLGGGVLAGAAVLAVVGTLAWAVRRRTRPGSVPDPVVDGLDPDRRLLGGFAAMGAAWCVQALVSIDVVPLILLAGVSLGGLVVLADPALVAGRAAGADGDRVVGRAGGRRTEPVAVVLAGVLTAASLALALVAVSAQVGNVGLRRGLQATEAARAGTAGPVDALDRFDAAIAASPLDADLRVQAGAAAAALAELPAGRVDDGTRARLYAYGRQRLEEAMDRQPGYPQAALTLADLVGLQARRQRDEARFQEADGLFARVQAEDPRNPVGYLDHGEVLTDWWRLTGDAGRRDQALAELRRAQERSFAWPKGLTRLAQDYEALGDHPAALGALDQALRWDPGYRPALELQARLAGGPAPAR